MVSSNLFEGGDEPIETGSVSPLAWLELVDKMTWEETFAAAKEKGYGADMLSDLQAMKEQYGEIPRDVLWLRLANYESSRDFYNLARQAYLNPDDTVLQAKLLRQLNVHGSVFETYKLASTRAAQATAIGRMQITEGKAAGILDEVGNVKIPSINDAEMKKMLADPNVSDNLKLMIEKFVQLTDEGAREGLLNKVSKVGLIADLWDRTWKNGLLSGTGTHVVNFGSNTTMLASTVATRAIAGGIGLVVFCIFSFSQNIMSYNNQNQSDTVRHYYT